MRIYQSITFAVGLATCAVSAASASGLFVTGGLGSTEGNSFSYVPLRSSETHYQYVIPESALVGLNVGDILTSLALRAEGIAVSNAPSDAITISRIIIGLSTVNVAAFGTNYVDNRGADYLTVFDGSYSSLVPDEGAANAFMTPFSFTEGYSYKGGDLLVDFAMTPMSVGFRQDMQTNSEARALFAQGSGAMTVQTGSLSSNEYAVTQFEVTPIPEPAAFVGLAGFTVLSVAACRRRRL